ncbi:hypothetical protein M3J09_002752 [Ascochyta lentis]
MAGFYSQFVSLPSPESRAVLIQAISVLSSRQPHVHSNTLGHLGATHWLADVSSLIKDDEEMRVVSLLGLDAVSMTCCCCENVLCVHSMNAPPPAPVRRKA